jgi:hypothetical protein
MATGAVAAIVYGEPRLTLDLDLVLSLSPAEVPRFAEAFRGEELYVPPLEVLLQEAARATHGHFNLLHHSSGLRADIYLASNDPLDVWGLAHRREERVGGEPVQIAPAEYVVVRKLEYFRKGGSTKHLDDIRAMRRVRPDLLDAGRVAAFVRERGLAKEWAMV